MYECLCAHLSVCLNVCMNVCLCTCLSVYVYVCVCMFVRSLIQTFRFSASTSLHAWTVTSGLDRTPSWHLDVKATSCYSLTRLSLLMLSASGLSVCLSVCVTCYNCYYKFWLLCSWTIGLPFQNYSRLGQVLFQRRFYRQELKSCTSARCHREFKIKNWTRGGYK